MRVMDPRGVRLAGKLRKRGLTFLELSVLMDLRQRVRQIEKENVPGVLIEAGCALGGSAILMASSKSRSRPLEVYDVFGQIPPPTAMDGKDVQARYEVIQAGEAIGFQGDLYYGYQSELKQKVTGNFQSFGYPCRENRVRLIEGLFQDTITPTEPVAMAHIDGDWYESVKVCLERIWPNLSIGGAIVVDDYDDWSGCRRAVDEFLAITPNCQVARMTRLHLMRTE